MKPIPSLLLVFATLLGATHAQREGVMMINFPEVEAQDLMDVYTQITKAKVLFREEKEKRRLLSVVSNEQLSYKEGEKVIVEAMRLEGFELRKMEDGVVQIVRALNDEETKRLNEEAGRNWPGPRYANEPRGGGGARRVPPPDGKPPAIRRVPEQSKG